MSLPDLPRYAPLALALMLVVATASAQDAEAVLTLDAAVDLALTQQPQLEAQRAAADGARESVAAASQLPDPRLSFGISDLTITGPDSYSLRRESDTQIMTGISQDFPRGDSRRLRGVRAQHLADWQDSELQRLRRDIERETALAWIDAWKPERAQALALAAAEQAELQTQAADIAYRAGKASQSDLLAARVALEMLRDEIAADKQAAAHARNQLSRWIGAAAFRPLPPALPQRPLPALASLQQQMTSHPHLDANAKQVEVAQDEVALARQAYKPGWNVELDYGYRPEYADYATLKVGIDLPFFTHNRQDRELAARLAELNRMEALAEDGRRMHLAELRLNYRDWELLQQRLEHFDQLILPQAESRGDAARVAWQSGAGTLMQVLDARRAALALRLQRLDLEADNARHLAQLRYLAGEHHAQ
jgi:cobalt-zinc-cadmium efflux system outer membrane protein